MTTFQRGNILFSLSPNGNGSALGGPFWGSRIPAGRAAEPLPLRGISRDAWEPRGLPGAQDPASTARPSARCPMCDYNGFHHPHPSPCVYNHRHYSRVTEQKHPMQIRDARVS